MPKPDVRLSLKNYDDIFSTQEEREAKKAAEGVETVQQVKLSELVPFKNHTFKVRDDEDMEKTVESIEEFGVINPVIVRPVESGGYEIVSGHRRCHAAELAGLKTVPAIVRDLDDDAATILMVDSNLQRETILPSERAWAFKMKYDAIKHQGNRKDLTSSQVGMKLQTLDLLGEDIGESRNQIHRYIRLTNLIPELLEMVDNRQLAFNPAVELSYIPQYQQERFLEAMDYAQSTPSLSQAQRIKKLSQDGKCTLEAMCAVMDEEKKPEQDHITIKHDVLRKYFPKDYTPRQMEAQILKLLDQWQKKKELCR
jgi:ParB family chromosome partitioning protein